MASATRQGLAVITGASTGIGYELARVCARHRFDLIVVANEPAIHTAADELRRLGTTVEAVEADLSSVEGVDEVIAAVDGRPVDALLANAATGLGGALLDQDFSSIHHIIDTNITGTVYLVHSIGQRMRNEGTGRILITGSIAGFTPGPFNAIYNASKSFIDSFSAALRNELQGSGVTVTCLMPGATDTKFFERAGLLDTKLGQAPKDDPANVAEVGFKALMDGDSHVVSGWHNKMTAAVANITPAAILAEQHRKLAAPGSGTTGSVE